MRLVFLGAACVSVVAVVAICLFLLANGLPAMAEIGWKEFLLGSSWRPLEGEANGVGLAAPQVGILRRVVIVDTGEDILELVNPTMVEVDGEQEGAEGCLSVPGKYGLVKRPYYAKVRAQDRYGEWYEAEAEELIARCFCHELDHLDGIVYTEVMERFLTDEELEADEALADFL